jgi:hypothetical protein
MIVTLPRRVELDRTASDLRLHVRETSARKKNAVFAGRSASRRMR